MAMWSGAFFLDGATSTTSALGRLLICLSKFAFASLAFLVTVCSGPLKVAAFDSIRSKLATSSSTVLYLSARRFSSRVFKSIGFLMTS